jgi:hypothetical protein
MSATKFWRITRPRPTVWQLGLAAPPDNRLSPDIFRRLLNDLDEVEAEWRTGNRGVTDPKQRQGGALVIHSEIPKFFSNGLDDPERLKVPDFVLSEGRWWTDD